jgi:hypothetical protein
MKALLLLYIEVLGDLMNHLNDYGWWVTQDIRAYWLIHFVSDHWPSSFEREQDY